jgi:hypothetical protein
MKDAALHLEVFFPAAGATVVVGSLDLNVDVPGFSDQWRLGRLSLSIPALPNLTDNTKTITVDLQDSGDGGATFANTQPRIQATIPGVAATGPAAQIIDMPLPPGMRGPIQLSVTVPAGGGDNTAQMLKADWENQ